MNNSVLRVIAAHRPPFVFYNGNSNGGLQFTGMLIDLLPTLLGYAQISPTIVYSNAPDNNAGSLVNGSWTGEESAAGQVLSRGSPMGSVAQRQCLPGKACCDGSSLAVLIARLHRAVTDMRQCCAPWVQKSEQGAASLP